MGKMNMMNEGRINQRGSGAESEKHFPVKDALHTDVLEEKYGPIHAVVLRHDNVAEAKTGEMRIREARLVDEKDVLRTYALTFLTYDRRDADLARVDEEIRKGGLIGKTFRENGYTVKKNVVDVFILDIPDWMQKDFRADTSNAKARFTEFYAKKEDGNPVIYGTVLEVYSPDFRDPKDGINEVDRAQINPTTGTLQVVGIPVDEIWGRLDRASETNEWADMSTMYSKAQEMSQSIVGLLHRNIEEYFNSK
jgi:hypothetical protein